MWQFLLVMNTALNTEYIVLRYIQKKNPTVNN